MIVRTLREMVPWKEFDATSKIATLSNHCAGIRLNRLRRAAAPQGKRMTLHRNGEQEMEILRRTRGRTRGPKETTKGRAKGPREISI